MMSKSLDGLSVLIFGEKQLLPMRIEQVIAAHWPASEVNLESFESYEDALKTTRSQKAFGLNMVLDTVKKLPLDGVIKNLSKPYEESKGFPCSTILLAERMPTMSGYKLLAENPNIIGYVNVQELLDPMTGKQAIKNLWQLYISSLNARLLPDALKDFIKQQAIGSGASMPSLHFKERVTNLLTINADISWMENLALSWVHLIQAQECFAQNSAEFLPSNLVKILAPTDLSLSANSLAMISKSSERLGVKILSAVKMMDHWRQNSELESQLTAECRDVKKFSPFLMRTIAGGFNGILRFADDAVDKSVVSENRKAG
jgi:hypothetical protein